MLRTFLVIFLGPGTGGEGYAVVENFKEFALNFCVCLFFYLLLMDWANGPGNVV